MKLKSNYKTDDTEFKAGVEVAIHSVNDNYDDKECSVFISLKSETIDSVRGIGTFNYNETWTDEDVVNHIKTKLDIE